MKKFLIVDDEPIILESLEMVLESQFENKIKIDTAINGKDALDQIINNNYDFLITDINMPIMDGIELIRNIRNLEINMENIVVFTGHGDLKEKKELEKLFVKDLIRKPYTDQILDKINNYLDT